MEIGAMGSPSSIADHADQPGEVDLETISTCDVERSVRWEPLPSSVVKSTGRTMQILEFFDDHQGPANIAQVARALDYPQSSTSEIMRSLNALGYLAYNNRDRTFVPTSRVRFLGSWVLDQLHGEDRLSSLVRKVNARSGHAAYMAIRNKLEAQYIQVAQATTSLRLHLTPGQRRPLLTSTAGRALLKDVPDAEISKLVRRVNAERAPNESFICLDSLLADVEFVREHRYLYIEKSVVSPGAATIAMNLPDELFPVPTVLGLGGATEIIAPQKDALIRVLTEAIEEHLLAHHAGY